MPLTNSATTYGGVTKTFHWLTALLILSNIPIGLIASDLAYEIESAPTEALIERATFLFSLHKTIGVAMFFVALARIAWALSQPKPGLLNGDKWLEAWAAETVHWLLYGSLVAVPLSGWVHHAATSGFAPIWWPFGQNLPLVPKSEALSALAGTLHYILQWVLIAAIGAHVAGALKHHVLDRDATLRRMLPGHAPGQPTARQPDHVLPFVTALAVWLAALGGAGMLGWFGAGTGNTAPGLAQIESDWTVSEGSLTITVQQMGSSVQGSFADWTADITYDETGDASGKHGSADVTIAIGSLSLGSVTKQAMGADYFNVSDFPTAQFSADLIDTDQGHVARGTLTIRDQSVPVEMPFDLAIEGNTATVSGGVSVDRRAFGLGTGVTDANSLGFGVDIKVDLIASRAP
ncbi:cytochrome b/b6 domain-containing protein [uncultured Roseovarius sp.]|uniref:cytochrome b/b6 domain-containing protein n=1 Tax=Roseovarius sp. TaxID=1486281 RepID=UPI0025F6EEA2|nr:cytochrome b/b6 domain-containing protein [uncultured Roseovarius sp.]